MGPTALIVLDGWGIAPPGPGNAVTLANTPQFDHLWATHPHTTLQASGLAVGLPRGQMGNSEVGHMNLGAGRVVMQKQTFIQSLIESGEFYSNAVLRDAFGVRGPTNALHLMGLVSDGGVHSDLEHFYALLELARQTDVPNIFVHVFTDGRDVGPSTARTFMEELAARLQASKRAAIATVSGRYYAMDRDKRWERTQRAYNAIVCGQSEFTATNPLAAVTLAYERGETDEFIKPTVILDERGRPVGSVRLGEPEAVEGEPQGIIREGDTIFFFNFRADRARQLSSALLNESFDGFERCRIVQDLRYASLMQYDNAFARPYAFELPPLSLGLAEVLAEAGKTQYHSAETEKYPHVTYFFNALREESFPGEFRTLVPSPRVATYDLQPEMSAPALTEAAVSRIRDYDDDFILINFANPDMVGHTGVIAAAIAACETVDTALGQVLGALRQKGGRALIVADHGNAEMMIDEVGGPHTAHTTNPVPCILVDEAYTGTLRDGGQLGDVAPTILDLMGLAQPAPMTGQSLPLRGAPLV